jgi:hypothetical protein
MKKTAAQAAGKCLEVISKHLHPSVEHSAPAPPSHRHSARSTSVARFLATMSLSDSRTEPAHGYAFPHAVGSVHKISQAWPGAPGFTGGKTGLSTVLCFVNPENPVHPVRTFWFLRRRLVHGEAGSSAETLRSGHRREDGMSLMRTSVHARTFTTTAMVATAHIAQLVILVPRRCCLLCACRYGADPTIAGREAWCACAPSQFRRAQNIRATATPRGRCPAGPVRDPSAAVRRACRGWT